jgi:hypothetical protein
MPYFKVFKCFIKVNFEHEFLREVVANRTHWLDCRMAKRNLVGKCSDHRTIMHMNRMEAHK